MTAVPAEHGILTPYPQAWKAFFAGGWTPLPLPHGRKDPMPAGWHGRNAPPVSFADCTAWAEDSRHSSGNTGLRLGPNEIGIDVDGYGGKPGWATWRKLIDGHEADPAVTSSAVVVGNREDGSGIRLFRLLPSQSEELNMLSGKAPGVELIRWWHRHVTSPGSLHPEGRIYWCRVGGVEAALPPVAELPFMPEWLWLNVKETFGQAASGPSELGDITGDVRCMTDGEPCRMVKRKLLDAEALLTNGGSRHDAVASAQLGLLRLGDLGHPGVVAALADLEAAWYSSLGGGPDMRRGGETARQEWVRALDGGIHVTTRTPVADSEIGCDCGPFSDDDPDFPGLKRNAAAVTSAPASPPARNSRFQPLTTARLILAEAPMLRDRRDDSLWVYHHGVWTRLEDDLHLIRTYLVHDRQNSFKVGNITTVAQTLKGLVEVFDPAEASDPRFLNVQNGMLDWQTGELVPHDESFKSTAQLGATWDPSAACPTIDKWLAEVLPPDLLEADADGRVFIDELLGYLVLSGNPFHKAVLLIGSGRNGKGTFLRLIKALLGGDVNVSAVALHDLVSNRFRAAELYAKLANIAGDLDGKSLESTAMFKMVTGGDLIGAERKFGQPFSFTPTAVPVFSTNSVFGTPDTSDGYMGRWLTIPFLVSFMGREDRSLDGRLVVEVDGLLVRAVNGLRTLMQHGNFMSTASIMEAKEAFERESDPIRAFVADTTKKAADGLVSRADIFHVYKAWALHNGYKMLAAGPLYQSLAGAGLQPVKVRGSRGFRGVELTVHVVNGELEPLETEAIVDAILDPK